SSWLFDENNRRNEQVGPIAARTPVLSREALEASRVGDCASRFRRCPTKCFASESLLRLSRRRCGPATNAAARKRRTRRRNTSAAKYARQAPCRQLSQSRARLLKK